MRPHAATQAGPYALTYDAAGNLTSKIGGTVSHSLGWDAENKLSFDRHAAAALRAGSRRAGVLIGNRCHFAQPAVDAIH